MQLLPLMRSKIRLGEPLPWNVRDKNGDLLLSRGLVVLNERQVESLIERGATVAVEEARFAAQEVIDGVAPASGRSRTKSVFDLWSALADRLKEALRAVNMGSVFLSFVESLKNELIDLTENETDIGIYLALRQENWNRIDYGYYHPIHSGMACILIANRLKWSESDRSILVKAALTMNLSIANLQGRIASQDSVVTTRQRAVICQHPMDSVDLLVRAGVTDVEWMRAVANHHEHRGGGGYPTGTSNVGKFAQAIRLADVFTSKLTPRKLRAALSVQEAERQMLIEGRKDADALEMVMALIKEFGIYPPGDLVQLNSGEIGVVVKRGPSAKAPIVATLTDSRGKTITTTNRRDTADSEFSIVASVPDKTLVARLPPERVYGFAPVNSGR